MNLSVVMPCFNEERYIGVQLAALARQRWPEPWELIVADNGSIDSTRDIVERYRSQLPAVVILDASDRRGQCHALNVGAAAARGSALLFCDADDEVGPDWLAKLGTALGQYDFVACQKDCTKLNPPWVLEALGVQETIGLHQNYFYPYLPHTGAGSIGIKRWLHEKIGGFNEALRFLEATDYCFRAQLAGAALHLVPEAVLHYRLRQSIRGIFRQRVLWSYYNVLLYKLYRSTEERDYWRWRHYIKEWLPVAQSLRALHRRSGRGRFVGLLGRQIGRLAGSIAHGVPPV
jgi:glycosyltransferase involved in cell wall biosynthesis